MAHAFDLGVESGHLRGVLAGRQRRHPLTQAELSFALVRASVDCIGASVLTGSWRTRAWDPATMQRDLGIRFALAHRTPPTSCNIELILPSPIATARAICSVLPNIDSIDHQGLHR